MSDPARRPEPRPSTLGRVGRIAEGLLYRCLFMPVARHLPPLSRWLRPLFVQVAWMLLARRRDALRRTARIVLGPDTAPEAQDAYGRRVMSNLHAFIAEIAAIDRCSVESLAARTTRLEGFEHLRPWFEARRGVILAGAHLGSFESSVAVLRTISAVPVHVVYARDPFRAFERARSRARRHLGIVEHLVERNVETWLALREALDRGEVVTILSDRVLPGQPGAAVRLLGEPALLPSGPIRLAAITGAPIIPTFSIPRRGGGATLHFDAPILVEDYDRALGEDHGALRELAGAIGRAVQRAPEHWLTIEGPWLAPRGDAADDGARPLESVTERVPEAASI